MRIIKRIAVTVGLIGLMVSGASSAATTQPHYYAYDAVEDANGVIAPWYSGQNGQCDFRVRIAAETLKRYPWTDTTKALVAAPEYVFNGTWSIASDGTISVPPLKDWDNGDWGQRAAYVLSGLVDYYRYSGDAAAIAHITVLANTMLDTCLTPADHPWPRFLISVPVKGKPYGQAEPHGMIQLDIVAEVGLALTRAYELAGNERWLEATRHWADVMAEKRNRDPNLPPWGRYANAEDVSWEDHMTGGVVFLLCLFDELVRLGYEGRDREIVKARDAGRAYLRDVLLPKWTVDEVWGRNYWDWPDPVQAENVTEFTVRYLMEHPDVFPNWTNDARNILSLFLHRTSVCPNSRGDVYSGAWAYPESSSCCGRSLWYGPMELATVWAQYGALADSAWAREIARRQQILATYDCHDTGVVEDNIDGGQVVAGGWFKIAHPMALKHVLGAMAWLPECLGANRENHIMRSSSVVRSVVYRGYPITYTTFDAPPNTVDVLRLAFSPTSIWADNAVLDQRPDLQANGYSVKELQNGDCIAMIRHDGATRIVVEGTNPEQSAAIAGTEGEPWQKIDAEIVGAAGGQTVTYAFKGNQVRLFGSVAPDGGLADVWVDNVKQLAGIDTWNPNSREEQVLYYKNGLPDGDHSLKIVVRGAGNPLSTGTKVHLLEAGYSTENGINGLGEGGGPKDVQRMIFGYAGREDVTDSAGARWRPGTELIVRAGSGADAVAKSWWTARRRLAIADTPDPEVYRYGVHAPEFWVNVTVGPGTYYVRLKFAETRGVDAKARAVTVCINGKEVVADMDVAATAGGMFKAVDLVFNEVNPSHGAIEVRFINKHGGEAMVQALEVGPGDGGASASPVCLPAPPPAENTK